MRFVLLIGIAVTLAACGPAMPPPQVAPAPPPLAPAGLDRVMGRPSNEMVALFGAPDLDVREPPARKLQFSGPVCVLDAYLYRPSAGADPVVTHIDARTPDGRDFDPASCVAALARRPEAR